MLLYHYTKLNTVKTILSNDCFKLFYQSFLHANDPKETKYWQFNTGGDQQTRFEKLLHERHICDTIKSHFASASFSLDDQDRQGAYKPRMWAQYADNHRGVCLVFDRDRLIGNINKKIKSHEQVYSDCIHYMDLSSSKYKPDELDDITMSDIVNERAERIEGEIFSSIQFRVPYLFRKDIDWRDENEYRIIVHNSSTGEINECAIDIPCLNAIREVVFGVECCTLCDRVYDEDRETNRAVTTNDSTIMHNNIIDILTICHQNQIPFQRIRWTNGCPERDISFDVNFSNFSY